MSIKILVDSASDIGMAEAKELGITMIPMVIMIGEEEYYDGVNLTPNEFYEKLVESTELPKTSQVTPYRFKETYKELTAHGDELIVITISSKLSGTYQAAVQAAEGFENKVFVVDSLNAAVGQRLLVEYALRLIAQGENVEGVVAALEEKKKKINLMAMLDTLEYLKKGGRISATVAFVGDVLSIKPVVALIDGEVKLIGKALGSRKANNLLNTLVEKRGGIDFSMPYGVVWSGMDKSVLTKYVRDSAKLWEHETDFVPEHILGATIGTHAGPGAVGVAFFEK